MSLNLHETITTSAMSSHHQTLIHTSLVFFPLTIRAWNNLPNSLIETDQVSTTFYINFEPILVTNWLTFIDHCLVIVYLGCAPDKNQLLLPVQ